MKEKWFVKNSIGDFEKIGRTYGIDPVLARLLVNRGINGQEELERYLNPSLSHLHSPEKMKDMEKACAILFDKIEKGLPIRIIGDYDVDGVMSTYILYRGLKDCGAKADYEIPDRVRDGYGINMDIVKTCIHDEIDTILTCDNGIAAREQIAYAKEKGLTVIVTDHHDIPIEEGVPQADAVVNPKQADCPYPFKGICGAAVAYKLMEVLYKKCLNNAGKVYELLEFAAMATVCDVMDLKDENRVFVKKGMELVENTNNIGLKALIGACGLSGKSLSAYHFGFVLGPCINASGRLESAKMSLRLLLTDNEEEAGNLAKQLRDLNEERKEMTQEGLDRAIEQVENSSLMQDKILVVYLPDCHESLAGIIAGRLRERYNKPAVVLTKTVEGLKGSGRSIEEYSMFEELSKCKNLLTKFGGHPMAAGLSLEEENMENLRKALNENTSLSEEDLVLKVSFDMALPFEKISLSLIRALDLLEPYGKGNTKPLFAQKDVLITGAQVLGANKNVLKLHVKSGLSNKQYTAMLFKNCLAFEEAVDEKYGAGSYQGLIMGSRKEIKMDFIFYLAINEYNGMQTPQIVVQNFR